MDKNSLKSMRISNGEIKIYTPPIEANMRPDMSEMKPKDKWGHAEFTFPVELESSDSINP